MVAESNPIVARRFRGEMLESIHRGAWVLVSATGDILGSAGDPEQMVFARSSSKSLQALGLFDSGAVERFAIPDDEVAVAVASHNGEPGHVRAVRSLLARAGLDESLLRCGATAPIHDANVAPLAINHNCSGKHAGFLAAAAARGDDPANYIDPASPLQRRVRELVGEMVGTDRLHIEVDGCSAPTFCLPLRALALGVARVVSPGQRPPEQEAACDRIVAAATSHPAMVAGVDPERFDTALMSAGNGRFFSKGGAEGVQVIGVVGSGVALAAKIDDGSTRALYPLALRVLRRSGYLDHMTDERLADWHDPVIRNAANLDVGHQEVDVG